MVGGTNLAGGGRAPMYRAGVHNPIKISELVEPSMTFLITENSDDLSTNPGHAELNINNGNQTCTGSGTCQRPLFGHFGMPNFLFADGHVKSLKAISTATFNPVVSMWNVDPKIVPPSTNVQDVVKYVAFQQSLLNKQQ